jgi:hypothetical protein
MLSALLATLTLTNVLSSSLLLLAADLSAIAFAPPDLRDRLDLLLAPLLARLRFAINATNFLFHKNTTSTICFVISQKLRGQFNMFLLFSYDLFIESL